MEEVVTKQDHTDNQIIDILEMDEKSVQTLKSPGRLG